MKTVYVGSGSMIPFVEANGRWDERSSFEAPAALRELLGSKVPHLETHGPVRC